VGVFSFGVSQLASLEFSGYSSGMGLAESIEKHRVKTLAKCTLQNIIDVLPETDREVLQKAISDGLPTSTLVAALRNEGFSIAEATFTAHRNGKCKCPKNA